MMSRRCHLFAAGLLCLFSLSTVATAGGIADPDTTTLVERVRTLAADEMGGRATGSPGARAAADSIVAWFAGAGLTPAPGLDGWFQDFPVSLNETDKGLGRNVVGWLPGRGDLAERLLVIGAHYDHLGLKLSDDGREILGVYNGAEDNASGVAALTDIAAMLSARDDVSRRGCFFVAFSGEEIGLLGSSWLVEHPPWDATAVDLMLNLDSVGRLRNDRLYIGGLGSSPILRDLVVAANGAHGLTLELSNSGWDASDHVSFNAAGIPVLFFFTGPHPQYHTVSDCWDLVAYTGLARVVAFVADVLDGVLTRPDGFPYTAQSELSMRDMSQAGKERAWLGTIPDFVEGVEGVRLAGVMAGGPAEESGLREGDVLIKLGDHTIAGLPDLTVALQSYGAGRAVVVAVMRDGERLMFRVTLRSRSR